VLLSFNRCSLLYCVHIVSAVYTDLAVDRSRRTVYVFALPNTAVVGSNPTGGTDVCCCFVFYVLWVVTALQRADPTSKELYGLCVGLRNRKRRSRPNKTALQPLLLLRRHRSLFLLLLCLRFLIFFFFVVAFSFDVFVFFLNFSIIIQVMGGLFRLRNVTIAG
jgi:hypothetical protein